MATMQAILLLTILGVCTADIYMQNPRGGNNRLDEANRDRANGNRMFDSQNNNRGGVNVGQTYYYAGSEIDIQWTSQHSCNNEKMEGCEIIVQYMCDDKIRDGTTTNTIPTKPIDCTNWDCDSDVRFGRHESWEYYMDCVNRERNQGLFTASQNLNGNTADKTRQNPNGARRGYECPEERDYYPYWGVSPWIDAAILTNQVGRCDAYKAESQNVKGRYYCELPFTAKKENKNKPIPIQQQACEDYMYQNANGTTIYGQWKSVPAHGVAEPTCDESFWSRDNHLGNVAGGQTSSLKWKVPSAISDQCVVRIRYNITSSPTTHFDTNAAGTGATIDAAALDYNQNPLPGSKGKKNRKGPANLDVGAQFKLAGDAGKTRGYLLQNNPQTDAFGMIVPDGKLKLQLAVNTAQYGRTFQDRTHKFGIRAPPAAIAGSVIHNVNVRGKRGNVVQTYPSTEYDFLFSKLNCQDQELVHFQWTGSNTNPNNNAGQGRQGTDRHNIVTQKDLVYAKLGSSGSWMGVATTGQAASSYPGSVSGQPFLGLGLTDRIKLALASGGTGSNVDSSGEMSELDDASTYFNLEPKACSREGSYNFLGTRNNNFSNRSEKESITVSSVASTKTAVGSTGGTVNVGNNAADSITFPAGSLESKTPLSLAAFAAGPGYPDAASNIVAVHAGATVPGADLLSEDSMAITSVAYQVSISYEESALSTPTLFYSASKNGPWEEVENAEFKDGKATATVNKTGFFMVETKLAVVYVVFIVLGVLLALAVCAFFAVKKLRTPVLASRALGI